MDENGAKRWYCDGSNALVQLTALYADGRGPIRGGDEAERKYVLAGATDGHDTIICILSGEAYEQYDRAEHTKFAAMVLNSLIQVRFRDLVYIGKSAVERLKKRMLVLSEVETLLSLPGPDTVPVFTIDKCEVVSRLKSSLSDPSTSQSSNGNPLSVNNLLQTSGDGSVLFQPASALESFAGLALSERFSVEENNFSVGDSSDSQWWKTDKQDLHFGEDSQISVGKRSKKRRRVAKADSQTLSLAPLVKAQSPVVLPVYPSVDENETGNSFGILLEAAEGARAATLGTDSILLNGSFQRLSEQGYVRADPDIVPNVNGAVNQKQDGGTTSREKVNKNVSKSAGRKRKAPSHGPTAKRILSDSSLVSDQQSENEEAEISGQTQKLSSDHNNHLEPDKNKEPLLNSRRRSQKLKITVTPSPTEVIEPPVKEGRITRARAARREPLNSSPTVAKSIIRLKLPKPGAQPVPKTVDLLEMSVRHKHLRYPPKPLRASLHPYTASKATFAMHKKFILAYLHHRANEL
jgi:hypothetical protein